MVVSGMRLCAVFLMLIGTKAGAVSVLNAESTIFGEVTHQESELEPDRNSVGLGASGGYSYNYRLGRHALTSGHILRIIGEYSDEFSDRARVTGVAQYNYGDDRSILTFNASHLIQSANIGREFVLDPAEFETLQIASVGGGAHGHLGDLTQVHYTVQLSGSFYEDDNLNGTNLTNSVSLTRRLSDIDSVSAELSRVLVKEGTPTQESRIDTGQLSFRRARENGHISLSIGRTEASTERTDIDTTSGSVRRQWESSYSLLGVGYRRQVTNTLIELLDIGEQAPEQLSEDVDAGSIRLNTLALSDQVDITLDTGRPCERCRLGLSALAEQQENLDTDQLGYSFQASATFAVDLFTGQNIEIDYQWRADSENEPEDVFLEVDRLAIYWNRTVNANTRLRAEAIQVWLDEDGVASQRFTARLSLTHLWGPGLQ